MGRHNTAKFSDNDVAELTEVAWSVLREEFFSLRLVANQQPDPGRRSILLGWIAARETEVIKYLHLFMDDLKGSSAERPGWASPKLALARNVSIFSDSINSGSHAIERVEQYFRAYAREFASQLTGLIDLEDDAVIPDSFTVGQLTSEFIIASFQNDLQNWMDLLSPFPDFPEMGSRAINSSVFVPTIEFVKGYIRRFYGSTIPASIVEGVRISGYETLMASLTLIAFGTETMDGVFDGAIQRVIDIREGAPIDYSVDDVYQDIKEMVTTAPRLYLKEDAITVYELDIGPGKAKEYLDILDNINTQIPIELRYEFEDVYSRLWTYYHITNGEPPREWVIDTEGLMQVAIPTYFPTVDYDVKLSGNLIDIFNEEWDNMAHRGNSHGDKPWGVLSGWDLWEYAAEKNLATELSVEIEKEHDAIEEEINSLVDTEDKRANPWSGPVMSGPSGFVLPLDSFNEAEALYALFFRGRIYTAFEDIQTWIFNAQDDDDNDFRPPRPWIEAQIIMRKPAFELALGDFGTRSVYHQQWEQMLGFMMAAINKDGHTPAEWEEMFWEEQARLIGLGEEEEDRILAGAKEATEMPSGLDDWWPRAKQIYYEGKIATLTDFMISEYYAGLLAQRSLVPLDMLVEYEAVMAKYRSNMELYRHGIEGYVWVEDLETFVERQSNRITLALNDWIVLNSTVNKSGETAMSVIATLMWKIYDTVGQEDRIINLHDEGTKRLNVLHQYESAIETIAQREVDSISEEMDTFILFIDTAPLLDITETQWARMGVLAEVIHPDLSAKAADIRDGIRMLDPYRNPAIVEWASTAMDVAMELDEARLGNYEVDKTVIENAMNVLNTAPAHPFMLVDGEQKNMADWIKTLLEQVPAKEDPLGAAVMPPFVHFAPLKSRADATTTSIEEIIDFARAYLEAGVFVEPKINGQRACLQVRDGTVRIFLEGDHVNWIASFPEIEQEASVFPDIVLDGEIVDRIKDRLAPDIGTGEFTRAEIDNGVPVFVAFDVIYYDGEDTLRYPYQQRREALAKAMSNSSRSAIRLLEGWFVNTEQGLREMLQKALDTGGSEGAMVKSALGKYRLGQTAPDWIKWRRTREIHVVVLGKNKNKNDNWHYTCGLEFSGEERFSTSPLKKIKGKQYLPIGKTFATRVHASVGEVLKVRVSKIDIFDDVETRIEWVDPTVVSRSDETADSIGAALNISRVLSASITKPYNKIAALFEKIDTALSEELLEAYREEAFGYYSALAVPRLKRMAYSLLLKIAQKSGSIALGKDLQSGINVAEINATVLQDAKDDWEFIEGSKTDSPAASLDAAKNHLQIIRAYYSIARSDNHRAELKLLESKIEAFIAGLGGDEGLTNDRIARDIGNLQDRAYRLSELIESDPEFSERERLGGEILQDLMDFKDRIGPTTIRNFTKPIQDVFDYLSRMEGITIEENSKFTSWEIQEQIDNYNARFIDLERILDRAMKGEITSSLVTTESINETVDSMRRLNDLENDEELTVYQRDFFKEQIGRTIKLYEALYEGWKYWSEKKTTGASDIPSVWKPSLGMVLIDIHNEYLARKGLLTDILYRRMSEGDPLVSDFSNDRYSLSLEEIFTAENIERFTKTLIAAESVDIAIRQIKEELTPILEGLDRKLNIRYRDSSSLRNPQPLGQMSDRSFWVSPGQEDAIAGFEYGLSELGKGNTLFVRERDEELSVSVIVSPDGKTITGDIELAADARLRHMVDGIKEEIMADPMAQILVGEEQTGLQRIIGGMPKGYGGSVEIIIDGNIANGYYGGDRNGKPFFVTNAHVLKGADESNVTVRLANGSLISTSVMWLGADPNEEGAWVDFDVAILESNEEVQLEMEPLSLGYKNRDNYVPVIYAVVLSPVHGEAELVRLSDDGGLAPSFKQADYTERTRGGYSGGVVIDEYGNVIGLWSAGASAKKEDWENGIPVEYGGVWYDTYGAIIPLSRLQEAYREAGLSALGGANLGKPWNIPRAMIKKDQYLRRIQPAISDRAMDIGRKRLASAVMPRLVPKSVNDEPFVSSQKNKESFFSRIKRMTASLFSGSDVASAQQPGGFMSLAPLTIPVVGELFREQDGQDIRYTFQFDWNGSKQSFSTLLGNVGEKWTNYQGGKLGTVIESATSAKAEKIDDIQLLPSRMRGNKPGDRYYEFYLKFSADPVKNGLWGISENASRNYSDEFFFFQLEDDQPFWLRDGHKDEIRVMPGWQKPELGTIRAFAHNGVMEGSND